MRRLLLMVCTAVCMGCVPPAPPPAAPVALHSSHPASEVAQIAAQRLVADGFALTTTDANGGIVAATRTRDGAAGTDLLTCKMPHGSMGEGAMRTELTLTVIARPVADSAGSSVQITSTTRTSYPNLAEVLRTPPNNEDCASNGTAEKEIAAAVK